LNRRGIAVRPRNCPASSAVEIKTFVLLRNVRKIQLANVRGFRPVTPDSECHSLWVLSSKFWCFGLGGSQGGEGVMPPIAPEMCFRPGQKTGAVFFSNDSGPPPCSSMKNPFSRMDKPKTSPLRRRVVTYGPPEQSCAGSSGKSRCPLVRYGILYALFGLVVNCTLNPRPQSSAVQRLFQWTAFIMASPRHS